MRLINFCVCVLFVFVCVNSLLKRLCGLCSRLTHLPSMLFCGRRLRERERKGEEEEEEGLEKL